MNRKHAHTSVLTLLMVGLVFVFFHLTGCSSSNHDHSDNQGQDSTRLMSFSTADFKYYSGGEQNDLAIFTERIAVGVANENLDQLTAWLQNDPLVLQPPEIEELGRKNLVLVTLIEGATEEQVLELIERLNASGLVEFATPVFGTEEEMTLITDAFVVRFLDTYSVGEIEAYIASQGATIVERDFLWPKCYRLSFTSQSGTNVLEMAGTFYESGMVIFAHPDFITVTEPPWQPLMEEDFETEFPQDVVVYDDNPADGQYYWGRVSSVDYPSLIDDYTEGSYKCWVAASHDPASPDRSPGDVADETYAPNMDAWMIFGPYDLSGSYWSQLKFIYEIDAPPIITGERWIYPEKGKLNFHVSVDGQTWTVSSTRSLSGIERNRYYIRQEFFRDMFGLVNIDEADQVWFALQFISDEDPTGIADEEHEQLSGVFVDDIRLLVSNTEPAQAITTDPFSCRQWALHNVGQSGGEAGWDINILPAWDLIDTIPDIPAIEDSIIVAVIDEGVDLNHEDLNLVAGYDATYDPNDPEALDSHGGPNPWDGHGTACAGIIGAKANDAGIVGVAPGVKIMPVRIASREEGKTHWTTDSDSAEGILWAANNGAQVLSNSWGGGLDSDILHNAIRDAKAMGCILVFASGNHDQSRLIFPARYEETIAVGAMSPCGERKNWESCDGESWGSHYGPELDVMAPGVMIPTCDISGEGGYALDNDYGRNNNYCMSFNGTSSATPHVAGIAALMLTVNPDLSPDDVQEILQTTARDLGDPGFDEETGHGLVDAYAAIYAAPRFGDLSVSQFSAPSPAVVGKAVSATCRITNSAPLPVGPLALRLYLSTDNQLDANDVMVGETTTTINSGNTNLDVNLLIPAETTPGSYLLIASVDDDGEVLESNETNNTFIASLHVIDSACLVVKPASVNFGTVVTGGGSQVYVELKNEGEGVLDTLVISNITFSGDAIFNNTEYNLIPSTPVELGTNESTYLGLYFMPETAGTYSGTITITSNDPNAPTTQIPLTGVATEPVTHTITASAGSGGSISPLGDVSILDGSNRTFTITPDTCRYISDLLVDGSSVGPQTSYTFENVTADHTISASFGLLTYAITASAGTGGSISPSNMVMVSCGGSRTFTITPDEHYHISNVLVDGVSVGTPASYIFSDVD
ncbi:MAG TPA: hypothetical protein ENN34_04840, partial [Deltaproteobacteria bacterium]|nr:hypothetical protein [Deltaproteobacteria bacterium]